MKAVPRVRPPASPPFSAASAKSSGSPGETPAPPSPPSPPLRGRQRGDPRAAGAWPGAVFTAFTTFFAVWSRLDTSQRGEGGACLLLVGAEGLVRSRRGSISNGCFPLLLRQRSTHSRRSRQREPDVQCRAKRRGSLCRPTAELRAGP